MIFRLTLIFFSSGQWRLKVYLMPRVDFKTRSPPWNFKDDPPPQKRARDFY